MTIHTIGDSHSEFGWTNILGEYDFQISIHRIGPVLCYSFGKEPFSRFKIKDFKIKDGDSIIFCFGEIDCRSRIGKYVSNIVNYKSMIHGIVKRYFEAIKLNVDFLNLNLNKICVFNVVPPQRKDYFYIAEDDEYPFLGSDEERMSYTRRFNKEIKNRCEDYNYLFFDVYKEYENDDGFLKEEFSDKKVHISYPDPLIEFIKSNIL